MQKCIMHLVTQENTRRNTATVIAAIRCHLQLGDRLFSGYAHRIPNSMTVSPNSQTSWLVLFKVMLQA